MKILLIAVACLVGGCGSTVIETGTTIIKADDNPCYWIEPGYRIDANDIRAACFPIGEL